MNEQTLKLEGYHPQLKPTEPDEDQAIRDIIVKAVFSISRQKRELLARKGLILAFGTFPSVTLQEIYRFYQTETLTLKSVGEYGFMFREKRTVDRRVNEAACPTYSVDGVPRIVAVNAGEYMPNPKLFKNNGEMK